MTTLPPPRVVTTATSPNGSSFIAADSQTTPFFPFGPASGSFSIFHSSDKVPVSNTEAVPSAVTTTVPSPSPAGVIFCTTDIPAGGASPMHRTISMDYACILSGEMTMVLDSGEETLLKTGDVVVQRGAMHSWANKGNVPCRMLCVMLGSEEIVTEEGKTLEPFFPAPPGKK